MGAEARTTAHRDGAASLCSNVPGGGITECSAGGSNTAKVQYLNDSQGRVDSETPGAYTDERRVEVEQRLHYRTEVSPYDHEGSTTCTADNSKGVDEQSTEAAALADDYLQVRSDTVMLKPQCTLCKKFGHTAGLPDKA